MFNDWETTPIQPLASAVALHQEDTLQITLTKGL